jgi:hypothetical protein
MLPVDANLRINYSGKGSECFTRHLAQVPANEKCWMCWKVSEFQFGLIKRHQFLMKHFTGYSGGRGRGKGKGKTFDKTSALEAFKDGRAIICARIINLVD